MNNDKRNYPTRMHEVLGVETGEVFTVTWDEIKKDFSLDWFGVPEDIETENIYGLRYPASGPDVVYMVNHPERITRRPRLTEEQREQLRAIWTLGGRWLAKDESGNVFAYDSKPQKIMICCYWNNDEDSECFEVMRELNVCYLVSWSDTEPYDIGKALGVGK